MKVKFYNVNHDINPKVIGRRYPQITHSIGGYWDVLDPESAYGQLGVWSTPTAPPPIGKLNLTKGAKYTDVLSASMFSHHGFIMSAKSKAVFEEYSIGNHWFFPVEIVHKERILDYFILHTNNDYIDQVDWEKSEFALSNWIPEKGKEEIQEIIRLDSKEHLFHLRDNTVERKSMYLKAHQLVFLPSFDSSQDMIAFYRIALGTLVSERLKIALEQEGISGIIFEESSVFEKWLQEEK